MTLTVVCVPASVGASACSATVTRMSWLFELVLPPSLAVAVTCSVKFGSSAEVGVIAGPVSTPAVSMACVKVMLPPGVRQRVAVGVAQRRVGRNPGDGDRQALVRIGRPERVHQRRS